jgi:hypothetical protein
MNELFRIAMAFAVMVLAVASLRALNGNGRGKRRVAELERKYATSPMRAAIVDKTVRIGMTEAEVVDAWGKPAGRSQRVLKTKTKQTLRYGAGRYAARVHLDNGRVVGWDQPK